MKKNISLILAIVMVSFAFAQKTYTFDKNHSRLAFSAVHLGISHVEGIFKSFDATFVSTKEDFSDAQIEMNADIKSLSTEVEMRDNALRDNWFEVAKYQTLSFKSTVLKKVLGNIYKLEGNISLHGVTKPITFNVVFNGKGQNPFSKKYSYGFTITGKLHRSDFGLGKDASSTGVSNDIELKSNVEFIIN